MVANSDASRGSAITLDELIALNDEIAALTRSGVPLEKGLCLLSREMPGRLATITWNLARRLEQGRSLSEVLGAESHQFPPVYRAVVEAGVEGGRLPAALESVAASTRRLAETRRFVAAGFLYPLILLLVAWCLFVLFVLQVAPTVAESFADIEAPNRGALAVVAGWGETVGIWWAVVPVGVVIAAAVWWRISARAWLVEPRMGRALFGWLPWLGEMLRRFRFATFSEILTLLVENGVPLHRALVLAAEAVGDARMSRAASEMAAALERGSPLAPDDCVHLGFPPTLSWMLLEGHRQNDLPSVLRRASRIYRRQAIRRAEVARLFLPALLIMSIGGSVTLVYAVLLFIPWASILRTIANP